MIAAHPPPPGGAIPPSRYNPHDAIHTAAAYLCENGAATADLRAAVYAYNHSNDYVDTVLTHAAAYRATPPTASTNNTGSGTAKTVTAWPAEKATLPDPSGTGGLVTPRVHALYQALHQAGAITNGATCWSSRPQNPHSDHPDGRACDIFANPHSNTDITHGWQLAHWLTSQQPTYGIRYLIWQGQIWTADNPTWTTYESKTYGCPNPANTTGCHYDHIHISIY